MLNAYLSLRRGLICARPQTWQSPEMMKKEQSSRKGRSDDKEPPFMEAAPEGAYA